ncbi:MAG: DUF1489 domain-containing protein [Alphaproteobacteria bacterium]|nr:DUF1489 domain-containing protein [Alphaproteobacteria bacterium]
MIHLIKLCVGVATVEELEQWRAERRALGLGRSDGFNYHRTRMTPRRADEIVAQGSLYWVIGGEIRGRQKIVALEQSMREDGVPACDIVMEPGVIRTVPQPRRPFQGWRYLRPEEAPADLGPGMDPGESAIMAELARLGLL